MLLAVPHVDLAAHKYRSRGMEHEGNELKEKMIWNKLLRTGEKNSKIGNKSKMQTRLSVIMHPDTYSVRRFRLGPEPVSFGSDQGAPVPVCIMEQPPFCTCPNLTDSRISFPSFFPTRSPEG